MSEEAQVDFLETCGIYAFQHSIARDDKTARVVTLPALKAHLLETCSSTYAIIIRLYNSLEFFLKGAGREMVRSNMIRRWTTWNYEIMSTASYMNDKRHDHHYFSELAHYESNTTLLFVFYQKEEKRRYENERAELKQKNKKQNNHDQQRFDAISNEIFELCHMMQPTDKFFKDTRSLLKRLQHMLDHVWPDMNYRIAIFGSTANLLGLKDADIDLCIVVPEANFEHDLRTFKNRLSRQPKSVYNMYFLASRLKSLGMKHVEAIGHASVPICKFVDPQTGFSCDINTNNILGIENTRMIGTYANLDVRIRPFLAAIKQFVKQKEINNPRGGTLSSYAYVIMALHFLMIGLEQPLIPSLQKSNLRCQSKHCNAKRGKFVHLYHDHQIIRCDARYHDCVHIRNTATSTYKMSPPVGKNDTITYWEGANKDTVSSILTQFFAYYANPSNHIVSIVTEDGALYGNYEPSYWHGNPIIVQDPFILGKNVARSCTTQGAYAIFAEFKRAAQLLQENTPFSTVCDKRYNIERSIDTECMEYRFQVQKHHHTKQYQTKDNYIGVLEEKELDEVIEILNPPLKDVSVVEEGKDQAMLALVKKIMSYQTVDSSIDHLTASPCTDMKALLHDPCMSKVELKDLYYLIAQMNFLGDALDDMFTEDKQEPDTKLNGFVEEESDELVDVFEHAHDEVTDVYFYILNVPITVDFYEIFLNLAWYGQLLSATPSRDPNGDDNEWLIHMKTPYINYKENRLPCFIELGKDQKQCTLSVPQLQPHELKRN